jgi:hypothetical protein
MSCRALRWLLIQLALEDLARANKLVSSPHDAASRESASRPNRLEFVFRVKVSRK